MAVVFTAVFHNRLPWARNNLFLSWKYWTLDACLLCWCLSLYPQESDIKALIFFCLNPKTRLGPKFSET